MYIMDTSHLTFYKSFDIYSVYEVELDCSAPGQSGRTFFRADGLGGKDILPDCNESQEEELRYYARDGCFYSTKLLHINPSKNGERRILTCGFKTDETLVECWWCCKMFPKGMRFCDACPRKTVFYCDEICQQKAWKLHRRLKHPDLQEEDGNDVGGDNNYYDNGGDNNHNDNDTAGIEEAD